MIKKDYTGNAELDIIEMYDFDTFYQNPTGINEDRAKLPTRYDISKFLTREGEWENKTKDYLLDFSADFNWQITYSFPSTLRDYSTPNGYTYGGKNVTFRRLYLILCERFNGGDYFIDEYFDTVYPYTVKSEVDKKLETIKEELLEVAEGVTSSLDRTSIARLKGIELEESGLFRKAFQKVTKGLYKTAFKATRKFAPNLTYKLAKKALEEYEVFARQWEESEGEEVARIIKEDIISCITSGQLHCQCLWAPSPETQAQRIQAGLSPTPKFSATEQLINSLQLFIKIEGNRKWETRSGLLV